MANFLNHPFSTGTTFDLKAPSRGESYDIVVHLVKEFNGQLYVSRPSHFV